MTVSCLSYDPREGPLTASALTAIVHASRSLDERLIERYRASQADLNSDEREQALETWKVAAAAGDGNNFKRRLAWDGLDLDHARRLLAEAKADALRAEEGGHVVSNYPLPIWAGLLREITHEVLRGEGQESLSSDERAIRQNEVFTEIWGPFARRAMVRVLDHVPAAARQAGPQALAGLERHLRRTLCRWFAECLHAEFMAWRSLNQLKDFGALALLGQSSKLYHDFTDHMLKGGIVDLFRTQTVFARFVGTVLINGIHAMIDFLVHFHDDLADLRVHYPEIGTSTLTDLDPSISDRHAGGRSCIRLRFSNGAELIYKPKSLRLEIEFRNLLAWVGEAVDRPRFRPVPVLNRGYYGWVAAVAQEPCHDSRDVTSYYERAGMLLLIVYLLGGTDVHCENLIAAGAYPTVIDLETLGCNLPELETRAEWNATALLSHDFFFESLMRTMMLPRWEVLPDGQCCDLSALGGIDARPKTTLRRVFEHVGTDRMRLIMAQEAVETTRNAVLLADTSVDSSCYVEDITRGFRCLYDFLQACGSEKLRTESRWHAFDHLGNRFIHRSTKIYAALLMELVRPQYLRDGMSAAMALEPLCRAFLINRSQNPPASWRLVAHERCQMMALDVPIFYGAYDSLDLAAPGGAVIDDVFPNTGLDQMKARLASLCKDDRERQICYIRSSFFNSRRAKITTQDSKNTQAVLDMDEETIRHVLDPESLIAQAEQIGNDIVDCALHGAQDSASWLTILYQEEERFFHIQPMSVRLYDGLSGVALFLAELACLTGKAVFADLACAALKPLHEGLDSRAALEALRDSGIGAGLGLGSVIYSLTLIADLLDRPEDRECALALAKGFPQDAVASDHRLDLLGGAAGCICSLSPLYRRYPDDKTLRARLEACGEHLINTRIVGEYGLRAWPTLRGLPLSGLSHGAAGIAFGLLTLHHLIGAPAALEAAIEGMAHERAAYDPEAGGWPDLRTNMTKGSHDYECRWCHGAPGILLARASGIDYLDTPDIRQDIMHARAALLSAPDLAIDHICCGSFGRVEAALTAGYKLHDQELVRYGRALAVRTLRAAQERGSFALGWDGGPYIPSFFQGMAGIGHAILRLARPNAIANVAIFGDLPA